MLLAARLSWQEANVAVVSNVSTGAVLRRPGARVRMSSMAQEAVCSLEAQVSSE